MDISAPTGEMQNAQSIDIRRMQMAYTVSQLLHLLV